jgi:hypothetical protein
VAVLTSSNGAFRHNNSVVGRCRGWTLNIQRDKVEVTGLYANDREYIQTLRGATGTAVVLYDPSLLEHSALFNRILDDSRSVDALGFVFYTDNNGVIDADCIIDSMSIPLNVGEVMATNFNFTIQGKVRGQF